jgi:hypothetical protein
MYLKVRENSRAKAGRAESGGACGDRARGTTCIRREIPGRWAMVIDASAVLLPLVSLSGLVLLFFAYKRRIAERFWRERLCVGCSTIGSCRRGRSARPSPVTAEIVAMVMGRSAALSS